MITLLWTKSNLPLSKLIRWGMNEPTSHFAVELDDRIVFHSNLIGTHLKWKKTFYAHSEIVHAIVLPEMTLEQEEAIYQNLIQLDERPYDFGAFFFFILAVLRYRIFKTPLPQKNSWAEDRGLLCTEVSQALRGVVNVPEDLDMITPQKLYEHIRG